MKRKIDFVFEDEGRWRKVFRFYPRRSHVHGFDDECPKNRKEVYKVYYAWSLLWQNRWDENEQWSTHTILEIKCDECSALTYLKDCIVSLKPGESKDIGSLGGANWRVKFVPGNFKRRIRMRYEFFVWERYSGKACRFCLLRKEFRKFLKYLDYINEYMLEHSEPI